MRGTLAGMATGRYLPLAAAVFAVPIFAGALRGDSLSKQPAAEPLRIRMMDAVSSHGSTVGSDFRAVVVADWPATGPAVLLPSHTIVKGKVLRARRVGLGLRHDRALLELGFSEYQLPDGRRYPLWASVESVDNAREAVKQGRIRGVLAASGPGGWVQGLWIKPQLGLVPRTFTGLAGLSGLVSEKLPLGPAGDVGLLVARSLIFRLPETEIDLPSGTDLFLRVDHLPAGHPEFDQRVANEAPDGAGDLAAIETGVTEANGKPVQDRINVALEGTRDEIIGAFLGAGWQPADSLTRDSFGRAYKAFVSMSGYPTAPVSPLYYQRRLPDLVFERGFNTLSKRHHIRLWQANLDGREVWLGAASHDIKMSLKKWPVTLTHKIDPRIDLERERVAQDLAFEGCAEPLGSIERPGVAGTASAQTDGRMTLLKATPCAAPDVPPALVAMGPAKRPLLQRAVRRLVLESRYHLLQGSLYFQGTELLLRLKARPLP